MQIEILEELQTQSNIENQTLGPYLGGQATLPLGFLPDLSSPLPPSLRIFRRGMGGTIKLEKKRVSVSVNRSSLQRCYFELVPTHDT